MTTPHDTNTIEYVNRIKGVKDIKFEGNKDLIEILGEKMDNIYLERIKTLSLSPDVIARHHDLKIVYTPIHGGRHDDGARPEACSCPSHGEWYAGSGKGLRPCRSKP